MEIILPYTGVELPNLTGNGHRRMQILYVILVITILKSRRGNQLNREIIFYGAIISLPHFTLMLFQLVEMVTSTSYFRMEYLL